MAARLLSEANLMGLKVTLFEQNAHTPDKIQVCAWSFYKKSDCLFVAFSEKNRRFYKKSSSAKHRQ